jgi:integrase/recombinase XerD
MLSTKDAKIIKIWTEKYPNPHTRYCYALDSERLLNHAKKPLSRITLADLQAFAAFLADAGLAPVSRVRVLAATKSLFGFCYRMHHILTNPAAELSLPRYENKLAERVLSEQDVQRILVAQQSPRNRILLQVLYLGGLRVSEATGLRWRNLHSRSDGGQITVFGKGGRTRYIAMPASLWSELTALRGAAGAEDPVFKSRGGKPLDRGRVRTILRKAAAEAGVAAQPSPHWLRHAHASHALDHGAPIHLVQATLGHSSVAATSVYLHIHPGDSSARFLTVASKTAGTVTVQGPNATRRAAVAPHVRRVAPGEGKFGEEGHPVAKKCPKALISAESTTRAHPSEKCQYLWPWQANPDNVGDCHIPDTVNTDL